MLNSFYDATPLHGGVVADVRTANTQALSMTVSKAESATQLAFSFRAMGVAALFATVTNFVAFPSTSLAQVSSSPKSSPVTSSAQPPAPLPVDEAFAATASMVKGHISVTFDVLPGHYLYRDRFEFRRDGETSHTVDSFKQATSVAGKKKKDPSFGEVLVFEQPVTLVAGHTARARTTLIVTYQGCSEIAGVCYPPTRRTFELSNGAQSIAATEVASSGLSKFFKKPTVSP